MRMRPVMPFHVPHKQAAETIADLSLTLADALLLQGHRQKALRVLELAAETAETPESRAPEEFTEHDDRVALRRAEAALEEAQAGHARTLREIGKAQARLDRTASGEEARWKREKERLDDALRRARVPRPLKVV